MKCLWQLGFQVKRPKVKVTEVIPIFFLSVPWLSSYLTDLLYTWYKYSPWHVDVSRSISRSKGQRSRSDQSFVFKVTSVIRSFCNVRSVAPSLIGWIISYLAYTRHMKGWCAAHHFQDERSKIKVIRVIRSSYRVSSVTTSLFHRFTSHEIRTQPMRSQCVVHHFLVKGSKVKVTQFSSCPLCGFLLIWQDHSIFDIHTTHEEKMCHASFSGWKVKGQSHMDVSKFLPCPLCSSVPISPIHFIWETHTTHEVEMCRAPFPAQNGHLKFLLSPPCGFLLIWPDVSCTIFINPLCGYIPIWLSFGGWGLLQL